MTTYRLHWRSLHGPETAAVGPEYTDREVARRDVGQMNSDQSGWFHWYFVEQPEVTIEPESNIELRQAVTQ